MPMQVEDILPGGLPVRENRIYALASGCCPQSARNGPGTLEHRCARCFVQVFKSGEMRQRNNRRMPLKRKQGNDGVS
jgi:hypothetical protein